MKETNSVATLLGKRAQCLSGTFYKTTNLVVIFTLFLMVKCFGQADLIVQDMWSVPSTLVSGQSYTLYVRVLNQGNTNAPSSIFFDEIEIHVDGADAGGLDHDNLAPSQSIVVAASLTAPLVPGVHQFTATADPDNHVAESIEGNNTRTESWSVIADLDLVILDIWTTPASPTSGASCVFYATVRNQGNASSGSASVGFFMDGAYVGQQSHGGLSPGQTGTVSRIFTAPSAGSHTIMAEADLIDQITESIEGNNTRTESIFVQSSPPPDTKRATADFDGDGISDYGCYDAVGRYGQLPGSWYFMTSTDGFFTETFGYPGTVPVVGDFDGDGIADYGCYDAAGNCGQPAGSWYFMTSKNGFFTKTFGYAGTVPIAGDFDGDGTDDYGCYDAAGNCGQPPGSWYLMQSTAGFETKTFGYAGTVPVGAVITQ